MRGWKVAPPPSSTTWLVVGESLPSSSIQRRGTNNNAPRAYLGAYLGTLELALCLGYSCQPFPSILGIPKVHKSEMHILLMGYILVLKRLKICTCNHPAVSPV
jgi:hypothetical protein